MISHAGFSEHRVLLQTFAHAWRAPPLAPTTQTAIKVHPKLTRENYDSDLILYFVLAISSTHRGKVR
jgi:hypothetical protein